jgi:predicted amino acid racemase
VILDLVLVSQVASVESLTAEAASMWPIAQVLLRILFARIRKGNEKEYKKLFE